MTTKDKVLVEFKVDIVVEPDEGEFYAYCPALKGLHVGGATEDEAVQNATDAALAYLQSLIKHNEPIPLAGSSTGSTRKSSVKARTLSQTLEVRVA